jgi:hypothetical protein
VRVVPQLCGFNPGVCLTTDEKARKNLSQGSRRVPAGTMKERRTWAHEVTTHVKPFLLSTFYLVSRFLRNMV